jgi:redox-sensitive bicupin YhaK (pirin superfamily)
MNTNIVPDVVMQSRQIEQLVEGVATQDGAGVKLTRVLTQSLQKRLDPFLMLDVFGSDVPGDYIGGFPDHPHRGFETVTYMLAGRMRHRDNAGHEGLLQNGDVQWMTAGRGIIHSEMPEQEEGVMEGFQLWLNLPAARKMIEPWYRDIAHAQLPHYDTGQGASVRVLAGSSNGVVGAMVREFTEPIYLDIELSAGSSFSTGVPQTHNAFIYVYRGKVQIGGRAAAAGRMAILGNAKDADGVVLTAAEPARVILLSGQPLKEPIAQYGPFVMNRQEEIYQAISDFREGHFAEAVTQ